jgi:hypothetical protein
VRELLAKLLEHSVGKRSLGVSGGVRGARVGVNTRRKKTLSAGRLGWLWRKRWR